MKRTLRSQRGLITLPGGLGLLKPFGSSSPPDTILVPQSTFVRVVPPLKETWFRDFNSSEQTSLLADQPSYLPVRYAAMMATDGNNIVAGGLYSEISVEDPDPLTPRGVCWPVRSTDGGLTWQFASSVQWPGHNSNIADLPCYGIYPINANREAGRIVGFGNFNDNFAHCRPMYSDDGGNTWQAGTASYPISSEDITPVKFIVNNSLQMLANNRKTGSNQRWICGDGDRDLNYSSNGTHWVGAGNGWYGSGYPDTSDNTKPFYGVGGWARNAVYLSAVDQWLVWMDTCWDTGGGAGPYQEFAGLLLGPEDCSTWSSSGGSTLYRQFASAVGVTSYGIDDYVIRGLCWAGDRALLFVDNQGFGSPWTACFSTTDGLTFTLCSTNLFSWVAGYDDWSFTDHWNAGSIDTDPAVIDNGAMVILPGGPSYETGGILPTCQYVYSVNKGLTWTKVISQIPNDSTYVSGQRSVQMVVADLLPVSQQRIVTADDWDLPGFLVSKLKNDTDPVAAMVSSATAVYTRDDDIIVSGGFSALDSVTVSQSTWTKATFIIEMSEGDDYSRKSINLATAPWLSASLSLWADADSYSSFLIIEMENVAGLSSNGNWQLQFVNDAVEDFTVTRWRLLIWV